MTTAKINEVLNEHGLHVGLSNDDNASGTWEWFEKSTGEMRNGFTELGDCYKSATDYILEQTGDVLPILNSNGDLIETGRYLASDGWGHIFEGEGEKTCRFLFDTQSQKIVYMDVMRNHWRAAVDAEMAHVEDSLINANEEAFDTPDDYGTYYTDAIPSWVNESKIKPAAARMKR